MPQFSVVFPPGSQFFINEKYSYINSDISMKYLEKLFQPKKSSRPTLLVFVGHKTLGNGQRKMTHCCVRHMWCNI